MIKTLAKREQSGPCPIKHTGRHDDDPLSLGLCEASRHSCCRWTFRIFPWGPTCRDIPQPLFLQSLAPPRMQPWSQGPYYRNCPRLCLLYLLTPYCPPAVQRNLSLVYNTVGNSPFWFLSWHSLHAPTLPVLQEQWLLTLSAHYNHLES